MQNPPSTLPKPFFILAPMDDVTDTVFRQLIASLASPDLFFTEFVNVDALQSAGREAALKRLRFTEKETPLIAQLWGKKPENYFKTAQELSELGYAGIDLNMGCPDKAVVKNGCCAALINNRELAIEIIKATQAGAGKLPVSVKTRIGFSEIDFSWHALLLQQKLNMLTVHGRTAKQLSKVPADWDAINHIRELRDQLYPSTLIVGNGDVLTLTQAKQLAKRYKLDGIMIGRGVFQDPFVFSNDNPWETYNREQRIDLYRRHVELFAKTWQKGERNIHTLNKFCKIYISGFDGAKELRENLMQAKDSDTLLYYLQQALL